MFSTESGDSTPKQMRTTSVLRPQPVIVLLLQLGNHLRSSVRRSLRRTFLFSAVILDTLGQRYRCSGLHNCGMFSKVSGDSMFKQMEDNVGVQSENGHNRWQSYCPHCVPQCRLHLFAVYLDVGDVVPEGSR
ncbi:hypothetical protein MTO96_013130 [Rhipicephalus appendiculatus]